MLVLLLHLMALIYFSASKSGSLLYEPIYSLIIWVTLTVYILYIWLPKFIDKLSKNNETPDFAKTQNIFLWCVSLWIIILQLVSNPSEMLWPFYRENFEQILPMLLSALIYYILMRKSMRQMRRLMLPILDPEQSESEFFRARITPLILVMPPVLLWMIFEDMSRGGLEIMYELKMMLAAPVFFVFLFVSAPKLLNWAWKANSNKDIELEKSIKELSFEVDTPITGIKIWNTFGEPLANAAVAGLSKKYRYVYITEFLLRNFDKKQVKSVVAHELGHLKLGHVYTYTIYSVLMLLLAVNYKLAIFLYFPEIDMKSMVFSLSESVLFVFLFFLSFAALSRYSEHQADLFSSVFAGKENIVSVINSLSVYTAEPSKSLSSWFLVHPKNEERVKKIQNNNEINAAKLLQQASSIRYAMLAFGFVLILAAAFPIKTVLKISALYEASQAKDAQLTEEHLHSLPDWLKKHPKVSKILHHSVSPEVTLDL